MLILNRKEDQQIVLRYEGISIKVMITEINREQVRVGIEAPREVEVVRAELLTEDRAD